MNYKVALIATSALALGTLDAGAQVGPQNPLLSARCLELERELEAGRLTLSGSSGEFMPCPTVLGRRLPAMWLAAGPDSTELLALLTVTRFTQDRRVLASVLIVVADTTRPRLLRAAALAAIISYRDPSRVARIVRDPARGGRLDVSIGGSAHPAQPFGEEPFSTADFARIDSTLERLAREDADADFRLIARSHRESTPRRP